MFAILGFIFWVILLIIGLVWSFGLTYLGLVFQQGWMALVGVCLLALDLYFWWSTVITHVTISVGA